MYIRLHNMGSNSRIHIQIMLPLNINNRYFLGLMSFYGYYILRSLNKAQILNVAHKYITFKTRRAYKIIFYFHVCTPGLGEQSQSSDQHVHKFRRRVHELQCSLAITTGKSMFQMIAYIIKFRNALQ